MVARDQGQTPTNDPHRRRDELAIADVIRRAGVELHVDGDALRAACPFHSGEPGHVLVVAPASNTWTCQACCSEAAGVVDWVIRAEGVSRRHAAELVRAGAPLQGNALRRDRGGRGAGLVKTSTVRCLSAGFDAEDDEALLRQVADYYHRTLLDDVDAMGSLARCGIGSPELVDHFKLGLANRTLGLRLPQKNRRSGATVRARLQRLGVLRKSGHEHLSGCLVVPLVDADGRICQLHGIKVDELLRGTDDESLWLDASRRGLLDPGPCASGRLLVAASIRDALVLWSAGERDVTAIHGSDGPLEDLRGLVTKRRVREVVLALPRSSEGERAAPRIGEALATTGAEVRRILEPGTPEVGELAPAHVSATPTTATAIAPDADELVFVFDDRRWRVRGLASNKARGTLRVNLLVAREQVGFHVDVLDLCSARHRAAFARTAADELRTDEAIVKKDVGQVLLALEQAQGELLRRAHEPTTKVPTMSEAEQAAALELLGDPRLLDRVLDDLARLGVVGERDNLLLAYLAAVSRKLAEPLAVVVQSSSAAGKSSLLAAVLSLVPEEDRVVYSAMTGQSLYYMGSKDLRHKVLSIAEDRGVERASYALKLLQSDGALTIASTGKDPGTGRLVSQEYRVEGPVAIMMTTTAVELDDELLSRCLVLAVDESPEQTRKIHAQQRAAHTLDGLLVRERREEILRLHHNAQRLLRHVRVVDPHADALPFSDLRVRARRDHRKLLALVEVIALLHQHQRPVKVLEQSGRALEVVEAQPVDMELARRLLELVTPGVDELPRPTRRLLELLDGFVGERAGAMGIHRDHLRFTRRQVREQTRLGDTHLKVHLRRLVDAELVLVHRAAQGRGVAYSLAFEGARDDATYDIERSSAGRGAVDPRSGGGRHVVASSFADESVTTSSTCASPTRQGQRDPENRTSADEKSYANRDVREPPETR